MSSMQRREWEQELRDRQRNIVFPDTVRNEGHFYRTLLRRETPLPGVMRFGLLLLATPFFLGGTFVLARSIAGFLRPDIADNAFTRWLAFILRGGISLACCLFGALMIFRAVFQTPPASVSRQLPKTRYRGRIRKRHQNP